jgi:hypothetical protein
MRMAQRLSRDSRLDTLMIYNYNRKGLQGKASGVWLIWIRIVVLIICSINLILKRTAEKAQATTKRIQCHSSITAALDATIGDMRQVRKLSFHKKVETVIIYDENRLREQEYLMI